MSRYVESTVRTNKLHCSDCREKIAKGDRAVFLVEDGKMEDVYGECCRKGYMQRVLEDEEHPYSTEALGQD